MRAVVIALLFALSTCATAPVSYAGDSGLLDKIEVMIAADWAIVTDPGFWLFVLAVAIAGALGGLIAWKL